jgi:aryl-alcohol dehydrogenase-like predicted oxidoreductase
LEVGINFFDTAWIYQSFGLGGYLKLSTIVPMIAIMGNVTGGGGNFTNEELLGKAIKIHGRDKFVIATKFGITRDASGNRGISGSEETIMSQLSDSLQRLGTDYVDLYYMHRMDPSTPIEETVRVLSRVVSEGKIRGIGLSECTPEELRRAHAVHPISAIQMEWSLQTRDIEHTLLPVARELGVGIVPYSPLARGLLTGQFNSAEELDAGDSRKSNPRWKEGAFEQNSKQQKFFKRAEEKGCSPAQLALAWVHAQGNDVFPIPGTKTVSRLVENFGALSIKLSPEEAAEIASFVEVPVGDRYADMSSTFNTRL